MSKYSISVALGPPEGKRRGGRRDMSLSYDTADSSFCCLRGMFLSSSFSAGGTYPFVSYPNEGGGTSVPDVSGTRVSCVRGLYNLVRQVSLIWLWSGFFFSGVSGPRCYISFMCPGSVLCVRNVPRFTSYVSVTYPDRVLCVLDVSGLRRYVSLMYLGSGVMYPALVMSVVRCLFFCVCCVSVRVYYVSPVYHTLVYVCS